MTWKERTIKYGSFAGAKFKVKVSEYEAGRRIKETDRYRERTVTTDLGPILNKFTLNAYIIQNLDNKFDYFDERNKLIFELNKYRSHGATLVHPFFGILEVHCEHFRMTESFDRGGIAEFEIMFVLETKEVFPGTSKDYIVIVDEQATKALASASDNFYDRFVTGLAFIESVGADAIAGIQGVISSINRVTGAVRATLHTAIGIATTALNLINSVLEAPCDLWSTMNDAGDSFKYIVGMAGELVDSGVAGACSGNARTEGVVLNGGSVPEDLGVSVVEEMLAAAEFDETNLPTITATQSCNRTATIDALKIQVLTIAMQVAIRIDYHSQNKMFEILTLITDEIENTLLRLGNNVSCNDNSDSFTALAQMRNVFSSAILEKNNNLKRNIDYNVPSGIQSALELAYNKYEDISREDEIYNKNRLDIKHPGFLPSGDAIVILDI